MAAAAMQSPSRQRDVELLAVEVGLERALGKSLAGLLEQSFEGGDGLGDELANLRPLLRRDLPHRLAQRREQAGPAQVFDPGGLDLRLAGSLRELAAAFVQQRLDLVDQSLLPSERREPRRVSPRGSVYLLLTELLSRGALGDGGKRFRVGHGDVRQDLPVEPDAGLLQAADQDRVRHAVDAGSRVDAGDPQRSEVAATDAPALGRLHHGALDRFYGALVATIAASPEALGELEDPITTTACFETSLDAHCCSSTSSWPAEEAAGGGNLLRQPVRQGLLQLPLVAPRQHQRLAEAVLALAVLAQGQVVAASGLARLDLPRPGAAKALHRAPLGLHLRHWCNSFERLRRAGAFTCTRALRQAFADGAAAVCGGAGGGGTTGAAAGCSAGCAAGRAIWARSAAS